MQFRDGTLMPTSAFRFLPSANVMMKRRSDSWSRRELHTIPF